LKIPIPTTGRRKRYLKANSNQIPIVNGSVADLLASGADLLASVAIGICCAVHQETDCGPLPAQCSSADKIDKALVAK
jgi:hypothetical protein